MSCWKMIHARIEPKASQMIRLSASEEHVKARPTTGLHHQHILLKAFMHGGPPRKDPSFAGWWWRNFTRKGSLPVQVPPMPVLKSSHGGHRLPIQNEA